MFLMIHHNGQINKQDILNGNYASSVSASESTTNITDSTATNQSTTLNTNRDNTEKYTRHFTGKQGLTNTYQKLIAEYRQNIVAIDSKIILELNKLFMGLY